MFTMSKFRSLCAPLAAVALAGLALVGSSLTRVSVISCCARTFSEVGTSSVLAASRIGLSQPAMSNALTRLRHLFHDELLVRTPKGMEATPRALELAEPVKQALRQIERLVAAEPAFDPATSRRVFSLRLSDLLGLLLLPPLFKRIEREAPGVELDVVHTPPALTVEGIEKDEIDLAVSMGLDHTSAIRRLPLMQDRMVCVMRRAHDLAEALSLEAFLSARHLKVSMSPTDHRFVDDVLSRQKRARCIAPNVPHWLLVPHVLERSNLLAVMPRRLAARCTAFRSA